MFLQTYQISYSKPYLQTATISTGILNSVFVMNFEQSMQRISSYHHLTWRVYSLFKHTEKFFCSINLNKDQKLVHWCSKKNQDTKSNTISKGWLYHRKYKMTYSQKITLRHILKKTRFCMDRPWKYVPCQIHVAFTDPVRTSKSTKKLTFHCKKYHNFT